MSITSETETIEMLDENFSIRGKSYQDGMLLLIEYLTEQDWKKVRVFPVTAELKAHLKGIIASLNANYLNALDTASTFKERKEHFDSLFGKYAALLAEYTLLEDPSKSLKEAECYSVWDKGRESLETTVNETTTLRETPYSRESSFREFAQLSKTHWFQSLLPWQQSFIKAKWHVLHKQTIPSSLGSAPFIANESRHSLIINSKEVSSCIRHATQAPIYLLSNAEEALRVTCQNVAEQIKTSIEQQFSAQQTSTKKKQHEVVILTQSLISPGTTATLKSKHISDSSDNDTQIYEMKEQAVARFQQALGDPKAHKAFLNENGLNVDDNGNLQYEERSIAKVTLLSTNHPYNILRRFGAHRAQTKRNDLNTAQMLGAVSRYLSPLVKQQENLISTQGEGWGLELEKSLAPEKAVFLKKLEDRFAACKLQGRVSERDKKELMAMFKAFGGDQTIKALFNNDTDTAKLLSAVKSLLSIPPGQGSFEMDDKRHRQSLTSALEVIIVNCIGGTSWIACKSGKDRTGGASAAIDAAEIFYLQRGRFPRYDDGKEDRAIYLQIFKALFESGHHQKVASQNAPGARGLVNPSTFLPGDIVLDAKQLQLETQLARLNKPKKRKAAKREGEAFNPHVLSKELDDMVDGTIKETLGDSTVLNDWQRNWNSYFIDGCSVKELRKLPRREGEEESFAAFKDEADLAEFVKEKLLYKIEDEGLKKDYLKHFLYAFHQGGFPHAFEYLFYKLETEVNNAKNGPDILYSQSTNCRINFSPLKNGIQIDAINTFDRKTTEIRGGEVEKTSPKHGGYYYRSNSCISVMIRKDKVKNKLYTKINEASVDCADERLKPLLFRERTLFEVLIDFFMLVYEAFKYWDPAKKGALNETVSSNNNNPRAEVGSTQGNSAQLVPAPLINKLLPSIALGFALCEQRFLAQIIALFIPPNPRIDSVLTCKGAFFLPAVAAADGQLSQKRPSSNLPMLSCA